MIPKALLRYLPLLPIGVNFLRSEPGLVLMVGNLGSGMMTRMQTEHRQRGGLLVCNQWLGVDEYSKSGVLHAGPMLFLGDAPPSVRTVGLNLLELLPPEEIVRAILSVVPERSPPANPSLREQFAADLLEIVVAFKSIDSRVNFPAFLNALLSPGKMAELAGDPCVTNKDQLLEIAGRSGEGLNALWRRIGYLRERLYLDAFFYRWSEERGLGRIVSERSMACLTVPASANAAIPELILANLQNLQSDSSTPYPIYLDGLFPQCAESLVKLAQVAKAKNLVLHIGSYDPEFMTESQKGHFNELRLAAESVVVFPNQGRLPKVVGELPTTARLPRRLPLGHSLAFTNGEVKWYSPIRH